MTEQTIIEKTEYSVRSPVRELENLNIRIVRITVTQAEVNLTRMPLYHAELVVGRAVRGQVAPADEVTTTGDFMSVQGAIEAAASKALAQHLKQMVQGRRVFEQKD